MKWPRSLFGRNLLLLIALLLASQLAWLIVFRFMVQTPRLERLASYVNEQNELLRFSLEQLPVGDRARVLHVFGRNYPDRLIADEAAPASFRQAPPRRISLLIAPLAKALGPDHLIRWERTPSPRLWIRTRLNDADYWMGFSTAGLVPEAGAIILAGSLLTCLLALIGAVFIQRHLHRPLQRLADAATAVALGHTLPPLAHDGPSEIASVSASFSRMRESLARADAERTLMLAGVSHDLRTPLAKVRLCVEMLRADADPDLIESMARNIETADAVIGQFVDFARVGSDEELQLCDPAELLRSVARSHGDTPELLLQLADSPPVLVRPVALRRAVNNLLENALRYAPGDVTLALSLVASAAGREIHFSVFDRGSGISEADQIRARQPFARLNESRGKQAGAGLGLAIVERIARLHNGHLDLRNRPDGGLIASIVLPCDGDSRL